MVALLVTAVAPAVAPRLASPALAGQRFVRVADEVRQVSLGGRMVRLEAASDRLVRHTRAEAAALVAGVRRYVPRG
jgi:hypothetical protein